MNMLLIGAPGAERASRVRRANRVLPPRNLHLVAQSPRGEAFREAVSIWMAVDEGEDAHEIPSAVRDGRLLTRKGC